MSLQEADRLPRYWQNFWPEFQEEWTRRHSPTDLHRHFGDDMSLVSPDESAWPTRAGLVERRGDRAVVRSGWGELKLSNSEVPAAQVMGELIEPAIADRVDPAQLGFDDPLMDRRFEEAGQQATMLKDENFVWCKSGGPYLRAAFMRGEGQRWIVCGRQLRSRRRLVEGNSGRRATGVPRMRASSSRFRQLYSSSGRRGAAPYPGRKLPSPAGVWMESPSQWRHGRLSNEPE